MELAVTERAMIHAIDMHIEGLRNT